MSTRIYEFDKCWSHPGRPLSDHQSKVAELMYDEACRHLNQPPFLPRLVRLIGLFHDLGKATWYFQDGRLREQAIPRRELGNHANFSALLSFDALEMATTVWGADDNERAFLLLIAIMVIRRHHGALKDLVTMVDGIHTEAEEFQLAASDTNGIGGYVQKAMCLVGLPDYKFHIPDQAEIRKKYRRRVRHLRQYLTESHFVLAGQLFSLLVWADKIDAATGGNSPDIARILINETIVSDYCTNTFGDPKDEISQIRNHVRQTVEGSLLNSESRLFTLTAPTGTGKTIAVMNAAIKLRSKLSDATHTPRIVYCMPFTSIIDQNYSVIQDVFESSGLRVTDDLLLKHHHLASKDFTDQNETEFGYDIGQLLTTSWDSEIIITTFIQLLNSMIGNQNKMMRKLLRIPGSIVLLDEVQAIPREFWETIEKILLTYANLYQCRFVLLTATKPLIIDSKHTVELLPDHADVFARFNRYDIHVKCEEEIRFADFKAAIVQSIRANYGKRILVVMNTVQSSIELFEHLHESLSDVFDKDTFIYLSTNITPRDRKRRIDLIRESTAPMVIVSTQVIEAGVDISVDIVHRDLAPLDSIIQSAGRCNRSNERATKGEVYVWSIQKDENEWQFAFIYLRLLLDSTKQVLVQHGLKKIPETDVLQLGQKYFELAKSRLADSLIHEHVAFLAFEEVHKQFKLIEDDSAKDSYFIDQISDPEATGLWNEFQALVACNDARERRRRLQQIKTPFFERVINIRLPYGADPTPGIQRISEDSKLGCYYHEQTGFKGSGLAIF